MSAYTAPAARLAELCQAYRQWPTERRLEELETGCLAFVRLTDSPSLHGLARRMKPDELPSYDAFTLT